MPYYPVRVTGPTAGIYTRALDVEGEACRRPRSTRRGHLRPSPRPGERLSRVDTPTTADAAASNPICTRDPGCPFHDVHAARRAGRGRKPVALLVATPAYCQTAVCGPVLDVLLESAPTSSAAGSR